MKTSTKERASNPIILGKRVTGISNSISSSLSSSVLSSSSSSLLSVSSSIKDANELDKKKKAKTYIFNDKFKKHATKVLKSLDQYSFEVIEKFDNE